jgi:hypothetical protein
MLAINSYIAESLNNKSINATEFSKICLRELKQCKQTDRFEKNQEKTANSIELIQLRQRVFNYRPSALRFFINELVFIVKREGGMHQPWHIF